VQHAGQSGHAVQHDPLEPAGAVSAAVAAPAPMAKAATSAVRNERRNMVKPSTKFDRCDASACRNADAAGRR